MSKYKSQLLEMTNWLLLALIAWLWLEFALFRDNSNDFENTTSKPLLGSQVLPSDNAIANYHLFGSKQKLYDIPLTSSQTSLNFTLNGTMSHADAGTGLAYISNVQGQQHKFRVGDKVFDVATLLEIHKDYVVFDNKGKKERLSLPEKLSDNSRTIEKNKTNADNTNALSKHLNGKNAGGNWEEILQQQKFDPNKIANIVGNVKLVTDQTGAIQGIRVGNLAPGDIDLTKFGLQSSDIITAVNGNQISAGNLFELGKTIQQRPNSIITIKRNGKIQNIQININDLNN